MIIQRFEQARDECSQDPRRLGVWLPILQSYAPALLATAESAERLAKQLVAEWLEQYMFGSAQDARARAKHVAEYFADFDEHRSHDMGIARDSALAQGVAIGDPEDDNELQDAVLSVHHTVMHTFNRTQVVKIIKNHLGQGFIKHDRRSRSEQAPQPQQPSPPTPS